MSLLEKEIADFVGCHKSLNTCVNALFQFFSLIKSLQDAKTFCFHFVFM